MLTLLIFIGVLSLIVCVHELGHFLAARAMGITVEEFGFGFPPRLFGIKKGDTTYTLNLIPLGGFVRLKGEQGEHKHDTNSFAAAKLPARALVIGAGVFMNFLLAVVLFTILFTVGVRQEVAGPVAGAHVRDLTIGVQSVLVDSPAAHAGLNAGDAIVSLDETAVMSAEVVHSYIEAHGNVAIAVKIDRNGSSQTLSVTPVVLKETGKPGIGVALETTAIVSYPWYIAPVRGVQAMIFLTGAVVQAFGGIITSAVTQGKLTSDVSGPVGIAVLTGQAASLGIAYLIQFVAILSINLGVINFLPIPALDGGRFIFLIVEALRRKPVSMRIEAIVHQVGFALLLTLVVFVTYRDIAQYSGNIFGGLRSLL